MSRARNDRPFVMPEGFDADEMFGSPKPEEEQQQAFCPQPRRRHLNHGIDFMDPRYDVFPGLILPKKRSKRKGRKNRHNRQINISTANQNSQPPLDGSGNVIMAENSEADAMFEDLFGFSEDDMNLNLICSVGR